ncbi:hypothetical protein BASA81_005613 [Batrachochytrium salamandrivorans]|nr:hypothetical protein BASA81_005613 [Batrachochytrium salamandrivorans]
MLVRRPRSKLQWVRSSLKWDTQSRGWFAGLVKVIMALKHKVLPKTINVKNPPTFMDYSKMTDSCLYLNTRNRPWFVSKEIGVRRAGLSSFGFGGANYHMVVEEYEQEQTKPYRMHDLAVPVVFSAPSPEQLKQHLQQVIASIEGLSSEHEAYDALIALRHANQVGQNQSISTNHARVGLLATDQPKQFCADLRMLIQSINGETARPRSDLVYRRQGLEGKTAAVFAGHAGSQYLHMFDEVAMNWPEFRQAVVDLDRVDDGLRNALYPRAPYANEPELLQRQIGELELHAQTAITAGSVGSFSIFPSALGSAPILWRGTRWESLPRCKLLG